MLEKIVEMLLGEDFETVTRFLGYEPDMEVFNNNQLLEMEIESVAKQMPDDCLMKFCEEIENKTRKEAEMQHNIQLVEKLLAVMEDYKSKISSNSMNNVVKVIEDAITNIKSYDEFVKPIMENLRDMSENKSRHNSQEKQVVHVLSVVNSEGYDDGTESQIFLYLSAEECADAAYKNYICAWDSLAENRQITDCDSNGTEFKSKEIFEKEFLKNDYVLIQMDSSHIQFEYSVKEIYFV